MPLEEELLIPRPGPRCANTHIGGPALTVDLESAMMGIERTMSGAPSAAAPGRDVNRRLTPAPASRVYNKPAASGQRPAASGQRRDVRPAPSRCAQTGSLDIGRVSVRR